MGCAASENNIIIGKKENDNNDLYTINTYKKKDTFLSLSNKGESMNRNYENQIYYMKEIISKYNILEQISNNEICVDYKIQLKSNNNEYNTIKIFQKRLLGKEKKIINEIQMIN